MKKTQEKRVSLKAPTNYQFKTDCQSTSPSPHPNYLPLTKQPLAKK